MSVRVPLHGWNYDYDVFLSYHDKALCKPFAAALYSALTQAGLVVYINHNNLPTGDQTNFSAIEASRTCIIIFSSSFDASKWFLEELEKILDCRANIGQVVVPVYYNVQDYHVRSQKESFGKAKSMRYRAALSGVSNMLGFLPWNFRDEREGINNIVHDLTRFIEDKFFFVDKHLVGLEARLQDVIQLLSKKQSQDTIILGIWGINGIGKTIIAKAIYNQMGSSFKGQCFLHLNVNKYFQHRNDQVSLQRQLLSNIYKTTEIQIDTVESGKMVLHKSLHRTKIFLVLDNVNNLEQLNALCGSREWFGRGSRIIITTRDRDILRKFEVDHTYRIKYMNSTESLELFNRHAFKTLRPIESYTDLCRDVVEYCGGFPLALEEIGSSLFGRSVAEWQIVLEKLKTNGNHVVMEKLRIGFDDLQHEEKEIFLKIATLFIGMDKDDVIQTLNYAGHQPDIGLRVLVDKSLVTIDSKNRIGMHTLVRAMGGEITRQRSRGMAETKMYDVFLSFRGEDSRAKFISHVHSSLQSSGIYVFKDEDGIQRGDQITVSLLQAIGQSKIAIVVLSRNYANSKWCLLELERIVEMGRTNGTLVLPVFYEVDPSEVRYQTGEIGKAFEYLISTISVDEYTKRKWKTALQEVGGRAGVVIINSRNESEDIKKIVELVTRLLDKTELFVADHPVGVESRVQDVIQLLNSQKSKDPLLLGIWGMGGIGKTTLAKAVYNKIRHDFDGKSFLFNVREVWKLDNDKVSLQQRLLSDIYKTTKIKIDTVESGKMILQKRLCEKRIFLVIDDVNHLDQLNALCGNRKWFGEGSRIIITTRDDDLLSRLEVDHVYRMKEMDDNESLELFNWHAFKQPIPSKGFTNLSRDVVKYSGGLPLALQVIGSFLLTRKRETEWNSVLEKLKLIPNDEVSEKLRISFDGLIDDDMKDIFLDIAFFFIGMDRQDVTEILKDCGHFPEIGISVLVQQSLVTVDRKNKIGMHDLLRDMGREIIRKKSKEGGKEPSRLWRYEDVLELPKDTSTLDVKGLTLKMSRMDSTTYLETKAFEKMDKLRLFQLSGVQLDGDYKYLPRHLRWLSWHGFPLKCTPSDFHQQSLVAVEFKYSKLERVWRKSQLLVKLKILNLSHSHNLRHTPNFSNLPNLEKLILKDCPSLSSVSSNIGQLKKILLINLKDCTGLHELPRSIYKLDSLKTLILSGCTKIDKLEEDIEQMISLTTLVADNTAIAKVPFAVVRSKSIAYISLCGYEGFARKVFPSIIQSWLSPTNSILSLVQTFAGTSCLDITDEQNNSFYCLSSIFEDLQNLQRLWLKCDSEAQLNQTVASILDSSNTRNCEGFSTSASIHSHSQVCMSSSKNSLTSFLIQMGVSCNVANILRESILQKMPPIGTGFLPGDNYPNWVTFSSNGSSVTFEVPQVDGCSLKTIMCIAYSSSSSSPDNTTTEGFKVVLLINCTKNTIQVYKIGALLASFDEDEWQRVISSIEPGNEIKVVVVFSNEFIVKKTTIYLVYDEPIEIKKTNNHCHDPNENIFGRLFFAIPSLARAVMISRPFWFCLAGIMVWSLSHRRSEKRRRGNQPILREVSGIHELSLDKKPFG
ncbi:disease resistance-like protein CSA1 [Trifolium pratense]|uniref:disease resistance-like protein CSA1 n=1 Tax=Trifolium pratense TaxID=57577 RepID=UPI001E690386|nr:disease resistance-like protein CSA1 [Trifolium pratense]